MPDMASEDAVLASPLRPIYAERYPFNVARTNLNSHKLRFYHECLNNDWCFDPFWRCLYLMDLAEAGADSKAYPWRYRWYCVDHEAEFQASRRLDTFEDVSKCLYPHKSEPWWRFIFLQASLKHGKIGCSKGQLQLLLTQYQVMPPFLDIVALVKKRDTLPPQAIFRQENCLKYDGLNGQATLRVFPGQVQHAFNLYSVVSDQIAQKNNQWKLAQTALYHSFGLRDGRTLWFVLEDSPSIHCRLDEASGRYPSLQPSMMSSPERSFIAALYVHLVVIESCTDNWNMYISDLEEREAAVRIGSTSFSAGTQDHPSPVSPGNELSEEKRVTDQESIQSDISNGTCSWPFGPRCPVSRRVGMTLSKFQRTQSGLTGRESLFPPSDDSSQVTGPEAQPLVGKFSLAAHMDLDALARELEYAILAIKGNIGVIADIKAQYRSVIRSTSYRESMSDGHAESALNFFFGQLVGIEKELHAGRHRLMAITHSLQSEQKLFSAVLQNRIAGANEFLTISAQVSARRMEAIALKTEQETVSMHVITVFTLIFLPGTFIATFFNSGIIQFNLGDSPGADNWTIHGNAMRLFLSLCLPLTLVILGGWLAMYRLLLRKRHRVHKGLPGSNA